MYRSYPLTITIHTMYQVRIGETLTLIINQDHTQNDTQGLYYWNTYRILKG